MGGVPGDEVRALSRRERAAIAEPSARRMDGHPARFLGRQPEQRARHAQHQEGQASATARVWSVAMAIGTPAARKAATGGSRVSRRK